MFPIICKIGPINIYSYGLVLALAFFVSSALAVKEAERRNITPEAVFNFLFGVFIFGILGSRIFYVVENAGYYFRAPLEIIMFAHGGLSWFGGLILGTLYGVVYLKRKKMSILKTLDLIAPYLALGQAIGRIGCLLNGCCYGKISELIPVQIYSSLAMLVIFVVLRLMQAAVMRCLFCHSEEPRRYIGATKNLTDKQILPPIKIHRGQNDAKLCMSQQSLEMMRLPAGKIFFTYLFLYSLKRFFIEFLRDDNPVVFQGLTLFQIISVVMFLTAMVGYAAIYFTRKSGEC